MSHPATGLVEPVPWEPGLPGEFPGQQCVMPLAPGVSMIFCWCPPTPPGQPFLMGSPPDEPDRRDNEKQQPKKIPEGFWLARHPVNQQQWMAIMRDNPSQRGKGEMHPVDNMSWEDAQKFCSKTGLRLPLEAEWEYACRAGTTTPFGIGNGECLNAQMANFDGNYPYGSGRDAFKWLYRERTLPQGSFPPNAWGLHDMHGQLWEWCEDVLEGRDRVLRGGSWLDDGRFARSAVRHGCDPGSRSDGIGFRPCPSSTKGQDKKKTGGREVSAERGKE
ncbi:MAG: formylglycine-generating enzyme family protein [Verrucomicrobia bacterium]|nr:formylglycine-generating enzyme family protein [Verrucomicrobiota bacterium]